MTERTSHAPGGKPACLDSTQQLTVAVPLRSLNRKDLRSNAAASDTRRYKSIRLSLTSALTLQNRNAVMLTLLLADRNRYSGSISLEQFFDRDLLVI